MEIFLVSTVQEVFQYAANSGDSHRTGNLFPLRNPLSWSHLAPSRTFVLTDISRKLLDDLSWDVVWTFMVPRGCILFNDPLITSLILTEANTFSFELGVLTVIKWITMEFGAHIHGSQMMYTTDFSGILMFLRVPSAGWHFGFKVKYLNYSWMCSSWGHNHIPYKIKG